MAKAFNLDNDNGAVVGQVVSGSPAEKAGLKAGDVIIGMNGKTITDYSQFRNDIAGKQPGSKVTLTILRDGKKKDIAVTLGELNKEELASAEGGSSSSVESLLHFSVDNLSQSLAEKYGLDNSVKGVVVTKIGRNSAAFQAGLKDGDVIVAANRHQVGSVSEFDKALEGTKKGDTVLLRVVRGNNMFFVAFEVY